MSHAREATPAAALLLAGAPLLGGSQSLASGLVLGIVALAATTLAWLALRTLGRPLAGTPRTLAAGVLAVALVSAAELLVRATAPGLHADVAPWLPLAAVPALALPAGRAASLRAELGAGVLLVLALAATGALRGLLGTLLPVIALAPGALLLLVVVLVAMRRPPGAGAP